MYGPDKDDSGRPYEYSEQTNSFGVIRVSRKTWIPADWNKKGGYWLVEWRCQCEPPYNWVIEDSDDDGHCFECGCDLCQCCWKLSDHGILSETFSETYCSKCEMKMNK